MYMKVIRATHICKRIVTIATTSTPVMRSMSEGNVLLSPAFLIQPKGTTEVLRPSYSETNGVPCIPYPSHIMTRKRILWPESGILRIECYNTIASLYAKILPLDAVKRPISCAGKARLISGFGTDTLMANTLNVYRLSLQMSDIPRIGIEIRTAT